MTDNNNELKLSVILTVVSGKAAVRRCLTALCSQTDFNESEIIVPYDKWSADIIDLATEFPEVKFQYIDDLGIAADAGISSHEHRLYDRRRAVGLRRARGQIIAMTEDHAVPADDWCQKILEAHEQPFDVIGGVIENAIDQPLNWAWYYCDFGRYGRPLRKTQVEYVSDVNVAYKREALMSVREVWHEAYHETIVHRSLRQKGKTLFLDERMLVYQRRPKLRIGEALRERIDWGRIFAETRVNMRSRTGRAVFAAGSVLLPPLLTFRLLKNMKRQNRTIRQMASVLPTAFLLLSGWSAGEFLGYLKGPPKNKESKQKKFQRDFVRNAQG